VPVLAGDVARIGPGEEAHDARDLFHGAAPADQVLVLMRRFGAACRAALRIDEPRHHAIHRDVVLRQIVGQPAREPHEAQLGGDDVRASRGTRVPRHAADVDDGTRAALP
jgi:hypothetical protein